MPEPEGQIPMSAIIQIDPLTKHPKNQPGEEEEEDHVWVDPLLNSDDHQWQTSTSRLQRIRNWIRHKQINRRMVWEYAVQWRWVWGFFFFVFIMSSIMYHYRRELLEGLETLSNTVKDMGTSGYLLIAGLIFLSAFPPMLGYGTYQTLSGFTFGFARGFPISYFGALFGAVSCFLISRIWLKDRVRRFMAGYPNLQAVVKAVEKKGFKLFILIRLSPYPFNMLNMLFAATDISLYHFTLGTAITLTKIALHVYIGANLTSFAKHVLGEEEELTDEEKRSDMVRYIAAGVGSILAFGVMGYVYVVAKQAVKEASEEDQQNEENMAFLRPNEDQVHDDWLEWEDSDAGSTHEGHAKRPPPLSEDHV
ncbi:snare associated Golgi protein-domain-containing protein [Phycomyces nitens]|nr:snare associated Golgi protein-domain-containing protein [Phycomyces nitens]